MNFLIIIKVYTETGSPLASTFVWIIYILPAIIIGPFAAAYVDLTDRKKMLIITNFFQMIILFSYALIHETSLFLSYGIVFLYSMFNQFYVPAEASSLPFLVTRENLPKANALFLGSYQVALFVGFTLTGLVTHFLGFKPAFFISGALMLLAFLSVQTLPSLSVQRKEKYEYELGQFFAHILEGYQFIRSKKEILVMFITIVFMQVSLAVVTVNLPSIASGIVGIPANFSGFFALPAGIGAIFAIESVSKLLSRNVSGIRIIQSSLIGMSIGLWVFVLVIPYLSPFMKLVGAFIASVILGSSYVGIYISAQTTIQVETPAKLLARVYGNTWFITTIATVIPLIFSATIAEAFGARILMMLIAFGMLGLILIYKKKYD